MLQGKYLRETQIYVHQKQICIETLFILAEARKEPKCLSTGKWINDLLYIHIMEYYSTMKRNKLVIQAKSRAK